MSQEPKMLSDAEINDMGHDRNPFTGENIAALQAQARQANALQRQVTEMRGALEEMGNYYYRTFHGEGAGRYMREGNRCLYCHEETLGMPLEPVKHSEGCIIAEALAAQKGESE